MSDIWSHPRFRGRERHLAKHTSCRGVLSADGRMNETVSAKTWEKKASNQRAHQISGNAEDLKKSLDPRRLDCFSLGGVWHNALSR